MRFGIYTANENKKGSIYSFGGLNRTRRGSKYEFSDMLNMSANEYPCVAPCDGRLKIADAQTVINTVCAPDITNTDVIMGITGVCDGGFYYNGVLKSDRILLPIEWSWQVEQKGNTYIINGYDRLNKKSRIFFYNIDTDEFAEGGKIMHNLIVTCGPNYIRTIYDDEYGVNYYTATNPDGTVIENKDFFLDYMDYTTYDTSGRTTMSSTHNIFENYFKIGDEVSIEGIPGTDNGGRIWNVQSGKIIAQPNVAADRNNTIDTDNMASLNSLKNTDIVSAVITGFSIRTASGGRAAHEVQFKLLNKNNEEVEFKDLWSGNYYYCSGVTLKKRTRVFDNITTHHGRIWGTAPSGNRIYSSASDDMFSFSTADIINKYATRIESDTAGTFTAICSYNNDLIAFKSESITIISGINPTNYNAVVINGIGCTSPTSVAVTQEGVIFLGYNGFYLYNGSTPICISTKLNTKYVSAVSGYDGNSYYACAVTEDGKRELLVYNMNYGLWHKQDDIDAIGFFRFQNGFYVADKVSMYKTDATVPEEWECVLSRVHDNNLDNKGINEIWIRAEVSEGAEFWLETAIGNHGFRKHKTFSETGLNLYCCPVKLEMGVSYQIKIKGRGKVVIYEIETRKPEGGRRHKEY